MISRLVPILAVIGAVALCMTPTLAESVIPGREIEWRFHAGDVRGAEKMLFDDSGWESVRCGHKWRCRGYAWFRGTVTIPETLEGRPTAGLPVGMKWNTPGGGEVYVNGRLQGRYDNDHAAAILLTERARPGQAVWVAVRAFMGLSDDSEGDGELNECDFVVLDAGRVRDAFRITVDCGKSQGRLLQPFGGLSQGGGMPDYSPETAALFREVGIKWFRMDTVLTSVPKKREDGSIHYDWTDFDKRVDFIRSIGAEPIICLSYMPEVFEAFPNKDRHARPRDWQEWEDFIYAVVHRYNVERKQNIRYWEVWNESNAGWIVPAEGEDLLETYLKLYDACARGVRRADPKAWIGGPCNAAGPWNAEKGTAFIRGEDFMRGLMAHCESTGMPLDFITWHEYFHPWTTIRDEAETVRRYLRDYPKVRKQVKEFILTEWSYAWWYDRPYDNEIGAAWAAASVVRGMIPSGLDKACYFLAKDWDNHFQGCWGMFFKDNRPKPAANVCRMFNMLAPQRIALVGEDDEIAGVASLDPKTGRVTVLLLNFAERYGVRRDITLALTDLPKEVRGGVCRRYLVDKDHSNIWNNADRRELEVVEELPVGKSGAFTHTFRLETNGVTLLELLPQKED